jgi:hypothetical protein
MQRIEEIAVLPDDFRALRGRPRRDHGVPASGHALRRVPAEPGADYWALAEGDAIIAELDLAAGDRLISLEPDAELELGFMPLELVERTPGCEIVLQRLDAQDIRAPRAWPIRRTIGDDSTVCVRIAAELSSNKTARRVFGVYLRVARATRSS